jgi:electron transfer flavoprotein beta subunit
MKILVPVKQVKEELNEWDAFALEAALQLTSPDADEVIVVTIADELGEKVLRGCLASGAKRAIRVWDAALEGADPLLIATVLAAVARAEQPELIICGAQSVDAANAATGIALAGLLDLARVAVVAGIERDGLQLRVQRELEGGAIEVLRIALPALLTVQSAINEPRQPTLREIKQARAKPLAVQTPSELGLDEKSLNASTGSRTVRVRERDRGQGATLLEGEPEAIATQIATIVREALSA